MTDRDDELREMLTEALAPEVPPLPAGFARTLALSVSSAEDRFPLWTVPLLAALLAAFALLARQLPVGIAAPAATLAIVLNLVATLAGSAAIVAGRMVRHA